MEEMPYDLAAPDPRGTDPDRRLRRLWQHMLQACGNRTHPDYPVFGAMGVTVCADWRQDFPGFCAWARAQGYAEDRWLVRIRLEAEYGPDNCAWVPGQTYKRYVQQCRPYTAFGLTQRLERWLADPRCVIRAETFRRRIQTGWTVEQALTVPLVAPRTRAPYTASTIPLGTTFGRLTVISAVAREVMPDTAGRTQSVYTCRCACGTPAVRVGAQELLNGMSQSCGCLQPERVREVSTIHGASTAPQFPRLYRLWLHLNQACFASGTGTGSQTLAQRGVLLYYAWQDDFGAFRAWALDHGYDDGLFLQRRDLDADYAPENCYWSPVHDNQREHQRVSHARRARWMTAWGETKRLVEWVADPRCRVSKTTLVDRLRRGWTPEEALTRPRYPGACWHTAFGQQKPLRAWADDPRCAVDYPTLRHRVNSQRWPLEVALTTPFADGSPRHYVTAFGETMTLSAWARDPRCRVPAKVLSGRIDRGWDVERAMTTPAKAPAPKRVWTAWGDTQALSSWARDARCVVSLVLLKDRLRHGWELEAALTTPSQGPKSPRFITAFGETQSLAAWERDPRCRVPLATLTGRLARGWDPDTALATPAPPPSAVTAFGETHPMMTWSRDSRCRVSYRRLKQRLEAGWDPEAALTTPPEPRKMKKV